MSRLTLLAAVFWLAFGLRLAYDRTLGPDRKPLSLQKNLDSIPMEAVGTGWRGRYVPLGKATQEVARVTEYLQREYTRGDQKFWLYFGYVGSWDPAAIHEPTVCFPNSGLDAVSSRVIEICGLPAGQAHFKEGQWLTSTGQPIYSLSSFYYNGKFDPSVWRLRAASLLGVRYFAVVTLSGPVTVSEGDTYALYVEILRNVVPQLVERFPAA